LSEKNLEGRNVLGRLGLCGGIILMWGCNIKFIVKKEHRRIRRKVTQGNPCKVNFSRYRPGVAQKVGRDIALLFHDRGTRRG
jgi:hypothetical protein